MLEQKIEDLTAALKANTAALLGGKAPGEKSDKPAKADKAEKPAKAEKAEKAEKPKKDKAPSLEKLRTTFETFLGVSGDEKEIRRQMVKEFSKEHGVAKVSELPEEDYAEAIQWAAEATETREEAIAAAKAKAKAKKARDEDEEDEDEDEDESDV